MQNTNTDSYGSNIKASNQLDYAISVKTKLTRGHNKEKVDIEEKQVNAYIKSLTKEQIQDLETPIFLVAASNGPSNSE